MSQWSLSQLLSSLHEDIQQRLSVVGGVSENGKNRTLSLRRDC